MSKPTSDFIANSNPVHVHPLLRERSGFVKAHYVEFTADVNFCWGNTVDSNFSQPKLML